MRGPNNPSFEGCDWCKGFAQNNFLVMKNEKGNPSGWPNGLSLGLPCWRSQVRNPLPAKARGLPSWSSSSHQACLVRVTSFMWFASYCMCAPKKDSGCRFPLYQKKKVLKIQFQTTWTYYKTCRYPHFNLERLSNRMSATYKGEISGCGKISW